MNKIKPWGWYLRFNERCCRSHDGRVLVVSSTDGYCTLVTFEAGELGEPYKQRPLEGKPMEVVEGKGKQEALRPTPVVSL